MALIPGIVVPAPEPIRRRYGLFDAAIGPLDLPTHGQGGGVRYVPNGCGAGRALGVDCYDPGDYPVKPFDGDDEEVAPGVFVAMASLTCTPVGYDFSTLETKAARRLEMSEQAVVETALWTGLDFEGNSLGTTQYPFRSLDGTAVSIGGNYDAGLITDVVGALERWAYFDQQYGGTAYLHAPVEVAAFAAEAGLIQQDGPRKITPTGSVWVFGAYPAGEVIVTGQTTVWRAAAASVTRSFERTDNQALLLAERAYSVSFDCFAGRAEFDPLGVTSP